MIKERKALLKKITDELKLFSVFHHSRGCKKPCGKKCVACLIYANIIVALGGGLVSKNAVRKIIDDEKWRVWNSPTTLLKKLEEL